MSGLSDFFLNEGATDVPVKAPAFSLTKVMVLVAPLGTALVAAIRAFLEKEALALSSTEMVVLIVAVLGFGAIIIAADLLARAIGAYADKMGKSSVDAAGVSATNHARIVQFRPPLKATIKSTGEDPEVFVVAASDGAKEEYLCVKTDGETSWEPAEDLRFPPLRR